MRRGARRINRARSAGSAIHSRIAWKWRSTALGADLWPPGATPSTLGTRFERLDVLEQGSIGPGP
jgi:hypothetical protein